VDAGAYSALSETKVVVEVEAEVADAKVAALLAVAAAVGEEDLVLVQTLTLLLGPQKILPRC